MKTRQILLNGIAALALSTSASAALSITYDLAAQFSGVNNPNGVWTYGESNGFGGTFTTFTNRQSDAGVLHWNLQDFPPDIPLIYYNPASSVADAFPGARIEARTAGFYPGLDGHVATYRFTAPATASYELTASFFGQDPDGTTSAVGVASNGVLQGPLINIIGFGPTSTRTYAQTFHLSAGSTIDVSVGDGGDVFNNFNDSTGLTLTITAVPEAQTYALFLAGLAAMGMALRGRRAVISRKTPAS